MFRLFSPICGRLWGMQQFEGFTIHFTVDDLCDNELSVNLAETFRDNRCRFIPVAAVCLFIVVAGGQPLTRVLTMEFAPSINNRRVRSEILYREHQQEIVSIWSKCFTSNDVINQSTETKSKRFPP